MIQPEGLWPEGWMSPDGHYHLVTLVVHTRFYFSPECVESVLIYNDFIVIILMRSSKLGVANDVC